MNNINITWQDFWIYLEEHPGSIRIENFNQIEPELRKLSTLSCKDEVFEYAPESIKRKYGYSKLEPKQQSSKKVNLNFIDLGSMSTEDKLRLLRK